MKWAFRLALREDRDYGGPESLFAVQIDLRRRLGIDPSSDEVPVDLTHLSEEDITEMAYLTQQLYEHVISGELLENGI